MLGHAVQFFESATFMMEGVRLERDRLEADIASFEAEKASYEAEKETRCTRDERNKMETFTVPIHTVIQMDHLLSLYLPGFDTAGYMPRPSNVSTFKRYLRGLVTCVELVKKARKF